MWYATCIVRVLTSSKAETMKNEALVAAREGRLEKLKQLLDEGADINARDDNGLTLLHHAAGHGQHAVCKCLLQNGADILVATDKNNTVLHLAVTKNDEALVKAILENTARDKLKKLLDAKTKATGTAALHVAAKQSSHANVSILLEYGANFEICNNAGEKPVDLATSEKLRELFRLIETSFRQAKSGDAKLTDDKIHTDALYSRPVVNCRNNEGHTLMQVIVRDGQTKYKLADKLVHECMTRQTLELDRELESSRLESRSKNDVDELLERAREQQQFWKKLLDDIGGTVSSRCDRKAYLALEMSHEVLLAYRKMVGHDQTLTTNVAAKVLEEVFEVLGFDPDERHVVAGDKDCYYNKLPFLWKIDVFSFQLLMNGVIYFAIGMLLIWINDLRLFRAVQDNDIARVQQLLVSDTYYEVPDGKTRTILSYAVENGNEDIIKLLLKPGATVTGGCGVSFPLYLAVSQGQAKIVQLLLNKADPKVLAETIDARPDEKCSVLHLAAKLGRLDVVKMLLRHGARYCMLDEEDRTPADVSTSEEVTRFLRLVDEYFRDAQSGDAQLIRKLEWMPSNDFLAVAATRNLRGETLAEVATRAGVKSIAETILRMLSARDSEALIAVKKGDVSRLRQLLDRDLDVDAQDDDGRTLLHQAASRGQREAVKCLLQKGADALLTTDKNNTVLHIAMTKNDEALVKVILENVSRGKLKKLLDAKTKATGSAALHVAAKQNSHENVTLLLQYGANFEIRNEAREKPVDLTTSEKLRELFRLIDSSFVKATNSDCKVDDEFKPTIRVLLPVVNCRNDEGRTLLQVFIHHCSMHTQPSDMPAYDFLVLRMTESFPPDYRTLLEPSRRSVLDELTERARDCEKLWDAQKDDILLDIRSKKRLGRFTDVFACIADEAACLALNKARDLLLTYRKAVGSLTTDVAMKSLEELLEVLDFDLEEHHAVSNLMERYYRKLTVKLNSDALSLTLFLLRIYTLIWKSIKFFVSCMTFTQLILAAKGGDISKVQRLIDGKFPVETSNTCDENARTILSYAVENGSTKMIKLLLKSGVTMYCECMPECGALSSLYLAVSKGHAKIVKLLLKKSDIADVAEVIDYRRKREGTALHVAAKAGRLDLVKMLLKYGASYRIFDEKGCTPLDVSTNEEVTELLRLVDSCFHDAKKANADLVYKLKAMSNDLFLAVTGTKNSDGQTLAVVASNANAKSIAGMISRMIREVQESKK